jgi:uncharacterized protein
MESIIHQTLKKIEKENEAHILYACESGSRSWGIGSKDSDYDVRFVYVKSYDHYLSINIENEPDVIQVMKGSLDISGWDLRKTLKLLYKSNPSIIEWINSPIKYINYINFFDEFKKLVGDYYSSKVAFFHYYHMTNHLYKKYLEGRNIILLKKYFYVIRSILAGRWVISMEDPIPINFLTLVDFILIDQKLKDDIYNLVSIKENDTEKKYIPKNPEIECFIEDSLKSFQIYNERNNSKDIVKKDIDNLNIFFKNTLNKYQPERDKNEYN